MSHSGNSRTGDLVRRFRQELVAQLAREPALSNPSFVLALSGGADSVALLHLLAAAGYKDRLRCVHVNHQLQAKAERWADFCAELCAQQNIPFAQVDVVVSAADRKLLGTEAAARNARYQALLTGASDTDVLVTAHHADDQLETLLHRLERGAGVLGIQGIKPLSSRRVDDKSHYLLRPLLKFAKRDLLEYLQGLGQAWVEDPTNTDIQYRRNFYRQKVVPQLSEVFATQLLAVADLAQETVAEWALVHRNWCADRQSTSANGIGLNLKEADFALPSLTQLHLQQWLQQQECSLPGARLSELIRQLKQGTALGHNPSYSTFTHKIFVRKRELLVRLS